MAFSEKKAAYKYINEYQKEKYERTTLLFPKGEKERIQAAADSQHLKLNDYIKKLIYDDLERFESGSVAPTTKETTKPAVKASEPTKAANPEPQYTDVFGNPLTQEEYDADNAIFDNCVESPSKYR